jgi:uncharacterized damage-inducible protein DinB
MDLNLNDLIDYTGWERQKWFDWLRQHGDQVLKISAGMHGDGRFETVGQLVRHIFSAEKRYIERLSGQTLSDPASVPCDNIEALFRFSVQARNDLKKLIETFSDEKWDVPEDYKILNYFLRATPRKIIIHILMHEIRHWAQIATLLRLNGLTAEFHDFLFSPVLGGEFRREQEKGSSA